MAVQHFLTLKDLPPKDLLAIVQRASNLKQADDPSTSLAGRTLALLFDKSSTRTRVAFEVAMNRLGGSSIFLSNKDSQLGRGETPEDSAKVLSRMVDCIAIRTFEHSMLERFASHSRVPVINALTDSFHPCQLLADVQTFLEHRGPIAGRSVAWIGDGNNMCQSYINASEVFDFELRIAAPEGYGPDPELVRRHSHRVELCDSPDLAVRDVDLVVTDVWASMGQEAEQQERLAIFKPYQVNAELMSRARAGALFMHCLPAHRGEEVSAEIIDAEDSVVWDEAENRMHSQRALLEYLCISNLLN
ncbi:MAG: ornithine carbamoyltransferase [Gammaproteobacteria bacterium]|nr:ornithine carbamoyltransferase [Pseudomonadales bacterium]MCP5345827.1 ornithine carbamoyltransferase [Pseudomonadales bacterium]